MLDAGIYTITFPTSVTIGLNTYLFSNWDDASTNPTRQIDLTTGPVTVTAYYVSQQTLSINSSPATGITFTLTKVT